MGIRVKFTPITARARSANKGKTYTIVTGGRLKLTIGGKGPNPTKPTDAEIEFYERKKSSKESPTTAFARIKGKVRVVQVGGKKVPRFDLKGSRVTYGSSSMSSQTSKAADGGDFILDLLFDTPPVDNFGDEKPKKNSRHTFEQLDYKDGEPQVDYLELPWRGAEEGTALEVLPVLKLDGKLQGKPTHSDSLDVLFQHLDVPRDGDTTDRVKKKDTATCYGVYRVYPNKTRVLKSSQVIPIKKGKGYHPINIYFHNTAVSAYGGTLPKAKVKKMLRKVFGNAGFPEVNVSFDVPSLKMAGSDDKKTYFTRYSALDRYAARWLKPELDRTKATSLDQLQTLAFKAAHRIPFFDFYVYYEKNIPQQAAAGAAEMVLLHRGFLRSQDQKAVGKQLLAPIVLLGDGSGEFDKGMEKAKKYKLQYFVNVVAHEIGHCLGLKHGLMVEVEKGKVTGYKTEGGVGLMMGRTDTKGKIELKGFSPVSMALLKKRYKLPKTVFDEASDSITVQGFKA